MKMVGIWVVTMKFFQFPSMRIFIKNIRKKSRIIINYIHTAPILKKKSHKLTLVKRGNKIV